MKIFAKNQAAVFCVGWLVGTLIKFCFNIPLSLFFDAVVPVIIAIFAYVNWKS